MTLLNRISRRMMGEVYELPTPDAAAAAQSYLEAPTLADGFLKALLDEVDERPQARRVGDGHADEYADYTHVSSLVGVCTRQHALGAGDDRIHWERVTGGHRVMWAFGRAVEAHIRDTFLEATNNAAYGKWECGCKRAKHTGTFPGWSCPTCNGYLSRYRELTLFDHARKLKGNPDLIALYHGNWQLPVEIKSMNKDDWAALSAPKGDHITQVGVYHRLMKEQGFKVLPRAALVYASKDFRYGSPYKEYHIDVEATSVRQNVDAALAAAEEIAHARATGQLPPRRICSAHTNPRAKSCPFMVACWSQD